MANKNLTTVTEGVANSNTKVICNNNNVVEQVSLLEIIYPIGSIYMSVNNANPKDLFGFGEWEAWSSGRVPVGVWENDTDFNAPDKYGGSKTHSHGSGTLEALIGSASGEPNTIAFNASNKHSTIGAGNAYRVVGTTYTSGGSRSHNTSIQGETSTSSSMPPYQVCYMWKRTA